MAMFSHSLDVLSNAQHKHLTLDGVCVLRTRSFRAWVVVKKLQ